MGLFDGRAQASGLCRLDNCDNSERSSSRKFIKNNEAPYQMVGKRTLEATLGYKELGSTHFWLSVVSECLSCYLYVFIVCSTRISWTGKIIGHQPNLIAMALSSGVAMMLLIFTFRTVHVNPALTLSFLTTGRIPICRAIIYILAHCVGSVAAIAFLYSISIQGHNGALGLDNPHEILQSWQILIVEMVISFVVTLATYATCNYSSYTCAKNLVLQQLGHSSSGLFQTQNCDNDASAHRHSRRSVVVPIVPQLSSSNSYDDSTNYDYEYDNHRIYATQQLKSESSSQVPMEEVMQEECQLLAPNGFSLHVTSGQALVIGLAYTLASLSGIPASGASLNPARSLGPAFIMNRWDQHWVYWVGPILGAIIAGMFYEFIFNPTRKSSLCYRPKLFRLSAQDMAKVGSKSRSNQQQQLQRHQAIAAVPFPPFTIYRPHDQTAQHPQTSTAAASAAPFPPFTVYRPHNHTPQHPQTSRSSHTNNTLASPGPLKSPWEQHLITNSRCNPQRGAPNTMGPLGGGGGTNNNGLTKVVHGDPNAGQLANQFRLMNRHSATIGLDGSAHLQEQPFGNFGGQQVARHQQQQLLLASNQQSKPAFSTMMIGASQRPLSLQVDDRFQNRTNGRILAQNKPMDGRHHPYLNDQFPVHQQRQRHQTNLDQLDDDMYNVLDDDEDMHAGPAIPNSDTASARISHTNGNDLDNYVNHTHQNHSNGTPEASDSSSQRTGEMNSSNR